MKLDSALVLKIPSDVKEQIQKIADKECRTLSGQIRKILIEYLNEKLYVKERDGKAKK